MDTRRDELKERVLNAVRANHHAAFRAVGLEVVRGDDAKCPFPGHKHNDADPSLSIGGEPGLWKCHVCDTGGDIFDLVMRVRRVPFPEALRIVGQAVGVQVDDGKPPPLSVAGLQHRADNAHEHLFSGSSKAAEMLSYLEGRGLKKSTLRRYRIGFEPEPPPRCREARITIPDYEADARLVNIRRYLPGASSGRKMRHTQGYGKTRFYPWDILQEDHDRLLFCEGEWDALIANQEGIPAFTVTAGVGQLPRDDMLYPSFERKAVVILADNDGLGRKGARKWADELHVRSAKVSIAEWPDGKPEGYDVSDFLREHGAAQLQGLLDKATPYMPSSQEQPPSLAADEETAAAQKQTCADRLLSLFESEGCELFQTPHGEAYATIPVDGHVEVEPVAERGGGVRRWLTLRHQNEAGQPPNTNALQGVMEVLKARARYESPIRPLFTRLGEHEGRVYVDLANDRREIVEVDADGWRVVTRSPVMSYRPRDMSPLPRPEEGGDLFDILAFTNLENEADAILLVAFALGALQPGHPYPILALYGEQGSGKSTTARLLRYLIDPGGPEGRALLVPTRRDQDLFIALRNRHLLALDNISRISERFADFLCAVSTGAGWVARKLWTDQDESVIYVQKPIIINGIEEVATRGDLLDRCICLTLPQLTNYVKERVFWASVDEMRPKILGALLAAISTALRNRTAVTLQQSPRMADFASWIVAAEDALPFTGDAFLVSYEENRRAAVTTALETSAIGNIVAEFAESQQQWRGTASELLTALNDRASDPERRHDEWPVDATRLSGQLRRIEPALRALGVFVDRTKYRGSRRLTLRHGGE